MLRGATLKCTVAPATPEEERRLEEEMEMGKRKREREREKWWGAKDEREATEAKRELNVVE